MIYSVWNQGAWRYDYFKSPSVQDTANAPAPAHLAAIGRKSTLGTSADASGWPLPSDAVKIGSGEHPRGRIASNHRGSLVLGALGGIPGPEVAGIPVLGLAAVALGFMWWRSKQ